MSSLTKIEYEALAEFRYVVRQFMRTSEEAVTRVGLTPQKHQALLAIQGFPGRARVTVGELAERLQVRHHTTVGLIDRLAAQGLVRRELDHEDRRRVFVCLTRDGLELLDQVSEIHRGELQQVRPQIELLRQILSPPPPDVWEAAAPPAEISLEFDKVSPLSARRQHSG